MSEGPRVVVSGANAGVVLVELDRPPVNAVDQAMYREIAEVFDAVVEQPDVSCVVLTGRGERAFCAGNDLHEFTTMTPANGDLRMRTARRAFAAVRGCAVPVVAAVNGPALGTGFGLAACADMVVAAERATFGLPEMNVGVLGGGRFTARMLPEQAMRRLFFTARPVGAAELRSWGAPVDVVADARLLPAAFELAEDIAAKAPRAVRLGKQALNGCEGMELEAGYAYEQTFTVALSAEPDAKEAVAAVLERREPRFTGAPR